MTTRKLTSHEFKALEALYECHIQHHGRYYRGKFASMQKLAELGLAEAINNLYGKVAGYAITTAGLEFIQGLPPKDWNAADQ